MTDSLSFHTQQSLIDPNKQKTLYSYDLDAFRNSIWENFLGSQVQVSKLYDIDGTCLKITNKIVSKMGPVQLNLEHQNLYQAWDQSRRSEIEGF